MLSVPRIIVFGFLIATAGAGAAEPGFVPLFNDRDLSGWVNVNGAPETWTNRGGLIACTGKPISMLRTERQYENFILEAEWRHLTSGGNSGIFVWATPLPAPGVPFLRGIEVQILDNGRDAEGRNVRYTTHGDIFPTHGATMRPLGRNNGRRAFPSEERSRSSPEWNHYRITCIDGTVRLSVNGKEVTAGADCVYRKGYLALESEGAPVEFRNVRIKELPAGTATTDVAAPVAQPWRSLFNGLDLRGWRTTTATAEAWTVTNERITRAAGARGPENALLSDREFSDGQFIFDVKGSPAANARLRLRSRGGGSGFAVPLAALREDAFQRFTLSVRGRTVTVETPESAVTRLTMPDSIAPRGAIGFEADAGPVEIINVFARER